MSEAQDQNTNSRQCNAASCASDLSVLIFRAKIWQIAELAVRDIVEGKEIVWALCKSRGTGAFPKQA